MSAKPSTSTSGQPTVERVFVEIPKAGPGQGYQAPKNYARPLLAGLSKLAIIALCASLPLAPLAIIIMILTQSRAIQDGLLGLWIVMAIFIEIIAIGVAIGVAREAIGSAGSGSYRR
jgi:hypothetical protein